MCWKKLKEKEKEWLGTLKAVINNVQTVMCVVMYCMCCAAQKFVLQGLQRKGEQFIEGWDGGKGQSRKGKGRCKGQRAESAIFEVSSQVDKAILAILGRVRAGEPLSRKILAELTNHASGWLTNADIKLLVSPPSLSSRWDVFKGYSNSKIFEI